MSKIKGFIGETIVYGFANVFSRAFAMILIPLYTNFLTKVEYSNLSMLQSTFTILSFFLALNSGVFYYYYEYENVKFKKIVFSTWFFYQIFVCIFLSISVIFLIPFLEHLFILNTENTFEIRLGIFLICLQFLPFIVNNTNINYFRIDRKPKQVLYIVFAEALFTFLLIFISFKITKPSITIVLVSQIVARLIVALFSSRTTLFYARIRLFSKKLLKQIIVISWPFFIISSLGWAIISLDKFIGVQAFQNQSDVAVLTLATQLIVPLSVLTAMINQAIGPFIMSVRKDTDANEKFQGVFDLSTFIVIILALFIITFSPYIILFLSNESFIHAIYVLPLMALAGIIALVFNQICPSFSLVRKNNIIAVASISGTAVGLLINFIFMGRYGYVVSGISQVLSYTVMFLVLYIIGKRKKIIFIQVKNAMLLVFVAVAYITAFYASNYLWGYGNFIISFAISLFFLFLLLVIFLNQQGIRYSNILQMVKKIR